MEDLERDHQQEMAALNSQVCEGTLLRDLMSKVYWSPVKINLRSCANDRFSFNLLFFLTYYPPTPICNVHGYRLTIFKSGFAGWKVSRAFFLAAITTPRDNISCGNAFTHCFHCFEMPYSTVSWKRISPVWIWNLHFCSDICVTPIIANCITLAWTCKGWMWWNWRHCSTVRLLTI